MMTLIASIFPKLQTAKDVVRYMSKNPRFRRPFDREHDKQSAVLFKSQRQDLYHIYSSLWKNMSWKKSLLVICKILGLFINTLTADDKYSLLNRDNLTQPIQDLFLHSENLGQIWKSWKRWWPSALMYFWNYRLQKTWLDKCLKSPTSEVPFTMNMVNGPKHSWNRYDRTLSYLLINAQKNELKKVSLSDM